MRGDGMDETRHDMGETQYDVNSTQHDLDGTRYDVGSTQHDLDGTRYDAGPSASPYDTYGTQPGTDGSRYSTDGSGYDTGRTDPETGGSDYPARGTSRDGATRQIPADDILMRFGPGVTPDVIDTWRSGRDRPLKPKRSVTRRVTGLLVTLGIAVLAGVVVWWLLHGAGTALAATGATVRTPGAVQPCGSSVNVSGVITTNGGGGDVSYRWRRSDGQDSGILTDSVTHGRHSVTVRLRWTVTGPGKLHAVATLDVLSPVKKPVTATGAFDYSC
jgi:hypothetical protein